MDRIKFWNNLPQEMQSWPMPTELNWQRSQMLKAQIVRRIKNQGTLSFVDFMEAALYTPELGYYVNYAEKFGEFGDFTTAPNISPLFSRCVANQCSQVLDLLDGGSILEVGAGNGQMACDILLSLEKGRTPEQYLIVECSAALRELQRRTIEEKAGDCLDYVVWVDEIPNAFKGVIVANELLDALPAHRFMWQEGRCYTSFVDVNTQENIYESYRPANDSQLKDFIRIVNDALPNGFSEGQQGEVNLNAMAWLKNAAMHLQEGLILLLDYGYPQQEYYHPQRRDGTRKCFYRHHQHNDPFLFIGLQDISCHVDFTALVQVAVNNGLDLSGFSTQAGFLVGCGITQQLNQSSEETERQTVKDSVSLASQMDTLLAPGGMGELVKAIGFQKGLNASMMGFSVQDMSFRL